MSNPNASINLTAQQTIANVSSSAYTTDGDSGEFDATGFHRLMVGVVTGTFSGGTSFYITLEGKGPDGTWVGLQSGQVTANGTFVISAGNGYPTGVVMFPSTIRIIWNVASQGLTSANFSYWILGQAY